MGKPPLLTRTSTPAHPAHSTPALRPGDGEALCREGGGAIPEAVAPPLPETLAPQGKGTSPVTPSSRPPPYRAASGSVHPELRGHLPRPRSLHQASLGSQQRAQPSPPALSAPGQTRRLSGPSLSCLLPQLTQNPLTKVPGTGSGARGEWRSPPRPPGSWATAQHRAPPPPGRASGVTAEPHLPLPRQP